MNLPPCIHRGPVVDKHSVVCRFLEGGEAYMVTCIECPHANASRGLGDTVHKVTHALGIDKLMPDCGGCAKRIQKLNELVPYKDQE